MSAVLVEEGLCQFEVLSLRVAALVTEQAAKGMYVAWMQCSFNREDQTWECRAEFENAYSK